MFGPVGEGPRFVLVCGRGVPRILLRQAKPKSMQLSGLEDNVVLVDSVSKRYSMCGARIGAMVTKNRAVRKAAMKFAMARLSPPTLAQVA